MAFLFGLTASPGSTAAQDKPPATRPARPRPPARDPHTPGYVAAKELPDGDVPPADADGNFIIGPTHKPAPEMTVQEGVPQGTVYELHDEVGRQQDLSRHRARARHLRHASIPNDPAKLIVTTSHPAPYTRQVAVYVPKQYVARHRRAVHRRRRRARQARCSPPWTTSSPSRSVPAMIAISIGNGSGDAQGSERGLEYDTMSGLYAEFVEKEVLPLVEKECNVKLTKDPDGRATMGCSSGGSCALIMAWYHPELYHRVLTYSGTYVNQQWPYNPQTPARRVGAPRAPDPQQPAPSRCASGWKSATATC